MIGSPARWAFTAVCLVLGGCGNAYEHITVGQWQEVGRAEPPELPPDGAYVVTTQTQGSGPAVEPGDLVKASVRLIAEPATPSVSEKEPEAHTVWVWTGRESKAQVPGEPTFDIETYGDLGAGRVRIAFIGRRLHEQFEMHMEPGVDAGLDALPLHGIIAIEYASLHISAQIGDKPAAPLEWPAVQLTRTGFGRPAAAIEILDICKAKLYRRSATLDQRGTSLGWGDMGYEKIRQGILGWTAIDAQCPGPDGHVHFQAGPFHHGTGGMRLLDWDASYIRLRPPEKYPEEWRVYVPAPREIVNERLAPIQNRIVHLDTEQSSADLACQISKKCETAAQKDQRRQQRDRLINQAVQQEKALECELEKKCD
ncbi:MAG: hypothetical protein ACJ8R9_08085 [Steroidobacteraceae bacterium]